MKNNTLYNALSLNHKKEVPTLFLSTVSGVASTKAAMIEYFDKKVPAIDIITTKSFQVSVNPGNREPIICETAVGQIGNSVGLRNPGMDVAIKELEELRKKGLNKFLNISVSANCEEDFITLVKAFDHLADSIELNFSCPHASAGFGASIGCDINIASTYVKKIRERVGDISSLLFIKLTPNVENIGEIAKACVDSGADGIVAINTVGPIVHMDNASNTPILQNKLGGKGGCSGEWVYERALEAIKEIRSSIDECVPILAMGGISDSAKVKEMVEAGADAIGIGSALVRVNQAQWPDYFKALQDEYYNKPVEKTADSYLTNERQMEYKEMTIKKIEFHGQDTIILTLDKNLRCEAGQFAFLWLPGIGEKPFTLANDEPVTFVVKRRGEFTKALWDLKIEDKVYVRGIYGKELENKKSKRALLLAGGTGVAVLPSLARKLSKEGTEMTILVGTSEISTHEDLLEFALSPYGEFKTIADDGIPGRVLSELDSLDIDNDMNAYLVGPEIFMTIAAKNLLERGFNKDNIYLSMEKNTRCGVGICGECVCGDTLTCQSGTFLSYNYIEENASEMLKR